jgi:hypothetical protein
MDVLFDAFLFACRFTLVCTAIIAGVLVTIGAIVVICWGVFIASALLDAFKMERK